MGKEAQCQVRVRLSRALNARLRIQAVSWKGQSPPWVFCAEGRLERVKTRGREPGGGWYNCPDSGPVKEEGEQSPLAAAPSAGSHTA